ncbi:hypothetical protein ACS0TY_019339 [Phlomoides rotata]
MRSRNWMYLAKANDGEGPELLRSGHNSGSSSHAESLAVTLAEHQQHDQTLRMMKKRLCLVSLLKRKEG